ncbi:FAD-dependent oxidoreductase [Glaciecola sp. 2405UD65-10]|uniref:FAD-dependent oxidoreductase n=1 Tax=Glaciecola sp. 2405UD65-10 TaxID=3397244 RepID=UPI003B5BF2C9
MKIKEVDTVVVGGGMVGAAMALGLAQQGYTVALIEKQTLHKYCDEQAPDIRLSAFNLHSVRLLKTLEAWPHLTQMRYRSYSRLSVWENSEHKTIFDASEVNQDNLGYFFENRLIQLALYQQINAQFPQQVTCYFDDISHIDTQQASIRLASGEIINAKLMIGADGAQSQVRQSAGIACTGWEYSQHANAILIQTPEPVQDETWQEFHSQGPRALLPMYENYACLVWYDNLQTSQWIQQADHLDLQAAINQHFPNLIGDFSIVEVAGFPLSRMHAKQYGRGDCVILGDAAHTINPLAGQGVNLGFKDVSALLDIIGNIGINDSSELIAQFEGARRAENLLMMTTMDALYKTFSTPLLPIKAFRNMALRVANNAGPLKAKALKYAMGL